ncbi:MAG: molecular chaperone TorD family protein [Thermoleophilia bacterium]|nr:molecular chaperone TorD family protein [Thermoleophilia bacterium]
MRSRASLPRERRAAAGPAGGPAAAGSADLGPDGRPPAGPVTERCLALRLVARALSYPHPELRAQLEAGVTELADPAAAAALRAFLAGVRPLALGAWEEAYTRAFDLYPATAPYVGYHAFGDRPERGAFLAKLAAAERRLGVSPGGELPDHLVPVLEYLAVSEEAGQAPLPALARAFPGALRAMQTGLARVEAAAPYRHVLAWLETQAGELKFESPGIQPGVKAQGPQLTEEGRRR